jgi:divalent metal cation (Fe/Co/Zn/Cd) transporter
MRIIYFKLFLKLFVSIPLLFSGIFMSIISLMYIIKEDDLLGIFGIIGGFVLSVLSFVVFKKIYPKKQ